MMVAFFDSNVWRNLASLAQLDSTGGVGSFLIREMQAGRIITPKDVYDEIHNRPIERQWLDGVPDEVRDLDSNGLTCLAEIVNRFPNFLDHNKPTGKDADQPLVAMALARSRFSCDQTMVVTQERPKKDTEHRWHIPDACAALSLNWGDFNAWLAWRGYRISVEKIQ